jgi:hypothetical protein
LLCSWWISSLLVPSWTTPSCKDGATCSTKPPHHPHQCHCPHEHSSLLPPLHQCLHHRKTPCIIGCSSDHHPLPPTDLCIGRWNPQISRPLLEVTHAPSTDGAHALLGLRRCDSFHHQVNKGRGREKKMEKIQWRRRWYHLSNKDHEPATWRGR